MSRDTQADLDRLPDHFARMAEAHDKRTTAEDPDDCPTCDGTG